MAFKRGKHHETLLPDLTVGVVEVVHDEKTGRVWVKRLGRGDKSAWRAFARDLGRWVGGSAKAELPGAPKKVAGKAKKKVAKKKVAKKAKKKARGRVCDDYSPQDLAGADGSCVRSPCSPDPKVSPEAIAKARAYVRKNRGRKKKSKRPYANRRDWPLAVSYGLGVDSTAILVGFAQLVAAGHEEFRPDYITFADVGSEKPESYAYMARVNRWLRSIGFPTVTVVAYGTGFTKHDQYGSARTLEQQCLVNQIMPSISASKFRKAKCSQLWKQSPQNRWFKLQPELYEDAPTSHVRRGPWPGQETTYGRRIRKGLKILKAIGYDADEKNRQKKGTYRSEDDARADSKGGKKSSDYKYWYPLMDWGWNRARCIAEIEASPLKKAPPKSACLMCGASKKPELRDLARKHPDLLERALLIENVALNSLRRKEGGTRKAFYASEAKKSNGNKGLGVAFNWTQFVLEEGLLPARRVKKVVDKALEIVRRMPNRRKAHGAKDASGNPILARLPAFRKLLGFRGRRPAPDWDRRFAKRINPAPVVPVGPYWGPLCNPLHAFAMLSPESMGDRDDPADLECPSCAVNLLYSRVGKVLYCPSCSLAWLDDGPGGDGRAKG